MEKYLGDIIHEKGCEESITATIKERMRKLTSKCEEIIQIANTSLGTVILHYNYLKPLLHNCASWIGISGKHIKELQKFQNKFVKEYYTFLILSHRLSLIGMLVCGQMGGELKRGN